jgi:hypothetical protein
MRQSRRRLSCSLQQAWKRHRSLLDRNVDDEELMAQACKTRALITQQQVLHLEKNTAEMTSQLTYFCFLIIRRRTNET